MLGKGLARRLAADEALDLCGPGRRLLGRQLVLGRARSELVEREFQLVEKTLLALGAPTVERPTQIADRNFFATVFAGALHRFHLGRTAQSAQ